MNKFNICKNWTTKIEGMVIPRGAFYGKDNNGYWVCIQKELYPLDTPTLELYRWNNPETDWVLTIEQSATVNHIKARADHFKLWEVPVEYPKFTGLHDVSAQMDKCIRKFKCGGMKEAQRIHEERYQKEEGYIDNNAWEAVAPRDYSERMGSKTINRPNWKKTQYIEKPYLTKIATR